MGYTVENPSNEVQNLQVDSSGNLKTAEQGTPSMKVTDGTETWAIDTSNRGVCSVTNLVPDGTNQMPSLDAPARRGYMQLTDGNRTVGVDLSQNLYVTNRKMIPDGTNTMPSLDAASRAGFMKITDGTETANVDTSNRLEVAVNKISDGTTNASVTSNNQLETKSLPMKGYTPVHGSGNATNGSTTLHTVTTGKVFYVVYGMLNIRDTAGGDVGELRLNGNAVISLHPLAGGSNDNYSHGNCSFNPATPIPLAAGQTVTVFSNSGNTTVRGTIIGWEEDA